MVDGFSLGSIVFNIRCFTTTRLAFWSTFSRSINKDFGTIMRRVQRKRFGLGRLEGRSPSRSSRSRTPKKRNKSVMSKRKSSVSKRKKSKFV